MKNLIVGEAFILPNDFTLQGNNKAIAVKDGVQLMPSFPFSHNLQLEQSHQLQKVEWCWFDNQPFLLEIFSQGVKIAQANIETQGVVMRLYRHNGNLRLKILNEPLSQNQNDIERYFDVPIQMNVSSNNTIAQSASLQSQPLSTFNPPAQTATGFALANTSHKLNANMASLSKMQMMNLNLSRLHIGLGWQSKSDVDLNTVKAIFQNKSKDVDLDLSVALLNGQNVLEIVSFNQLRSQNNAVVHYGDADKGSKNGEIDNEIIAINFDLLPSNVQNIAIIVSSVKGHLFSVLKKGFLRLLNQDGLLPIAQFELDNTESKSGCLAIMLTRKSMQLNSGWQAICLADYNHYKTPVDMQTLLSNWANFLNNYSITK